LGIGVGFSHICPQIYTDDCGSAFICVIRG
jgi:hypothetical protein